MGMLRDTDKCPEIIFSAAIPATLCPAGGDKLYCALCDDLIRQVDSKEVFQKKENAGKVFAGSHITCYYDDFPEEIGQVRVSGLPYIGIFRGIY